MKNHPPIERGCALLTAAAWLDTEGISSAFNDIAEANVLIGNEPRQAHSIWLVTLVSSADCLCWFLFHAAARFA